MDHIAPGVIVIKNLFSTEEQVELITLIRRFGGLTAPDGGWNFFGHRGRNFCRLDRYPPSDADYLRRSVAKIRTLVESADASLIYPPSTHLLTLWYPDHKGMGWHRDDNDQLRGGNNGDDGAPVYSLTIGNSCIFEYELEGSDAIRAVQLDSGDVIVFGGPQRLMRHRVRRVIPHSFSALPGFDARINLTFRTCTDFSDSDEAKYQTDVYTTRIKAASKGRWPCNQ